MQAITLVNLQDIQQLQNLWGSVVMQSCQDSQGGSTCTAIDKASGTYKISAGAGKVTTVLDNASGQFEIGLLLL